MELNEAETMNLRYRLIQVVNHLRVEKEARLENIVAALEAMVDEQKARTAQTRSSSAVMCVPNNVLGDRVAELAGELSDLRSQIYERDAKILITREKMARLETEYNEALEGIAVSVTEAQIERDALVEKLRAVTAERDQLMIKTQEVSAVEEELRRHTIIGAFTPQPPFVGTPTQNGRPSVARIPYVGQPCTIPSTVGIYYPNQRLAYQRVLYNGIWCYRPISY